MRPINTQRFQWIIDLLFGVALIAPITYVAFIHPDLRAIGISIGVSIGYFLHVTQKMMIFSEMVKESVREEAEERVKQEAKTTVKEEAEERVKREVEKASP